MIDIIIFAIIAAVIAYRLYNTLGAEDNNSEEVKGKVINLHPISEDDEDKSQEIDDEHNLADQLIEDKLSKINLTNIKKIIAKDEKFSSSKFLKNTEKAFEIIIESFANGQKDALNKLCKKEIATKYINEYENQKKKGNKININLIGIESASIETISVKENIANIKIKFISEQISYVTDKNNKIISGDEKKIEVIDDIWVFERNLADKSPIWLLSKTEN